VRTEHDKVWVLRSGNGSGQEKLPQSDPVDAVLLLQATQEDNEAMIRGLIRRWIPEGRISDTENGLSVLEMSHGLTSEEALPEISQNPDSKEKNLAQLP